ncbi:MAG TPA: replication-associated recombination protein A [Solirubrobacteraceae bacterium]|jgi:putative ATPase|nr:replication-associated recombination protein A [Solirubrobacteraceae bacterium]
MSDTLFGPDPGRESGSGSRRPLAVRMRPQGLEGFAGQAHLLGPESALRAAIEQGRPHSMILAGPPGTGKTTLARIVAGASGSTFEELSAVQAGRAEVRGVLERAAHRRSLGEPPTILFLDEIHRFNKAQQDVLLPAVEEGLIVLIGATTENPAFEVNSALLSRTRVYALTALSEDDVLALLARAVAGGEAIETDPDALALIAARAGGDARVALSALELASETAAAAGEATVSLERAADALQRAGVWYDRAGDRHYDYISAWIKATRGSDPDASLYYLAVMLEGGEDPRFIARRMVIFASEDVGGADPSALSVAVAAAAAVDRVGLPECHFALAQAAVWLALAPKSNAAGAALSAAREHVRTHGAAPVPPHLRSGPRPGQEVGGYDYPHSHAGHVSPQELMPERLVGERFYRPDEAEARLAERLRAVRRARGREE